ncbi:interferon alpha/beta receptor 1 [Pogona vitticeps]
MEGAVALLVAFVALGLAPTCTGLICLEQPYNITVHIINANIILKWNWDNPCGLNVTFSACYEELQEDGEKAISECQNVTITECDISSTIINYLHEHIVSVRVNTAKNHSSWASLKFWPSIEAQIGPPEVWLESINGNEKLIILHPETNQPKQMWKGESLTYKLAIWKNSSHPKEKTHDVLPGQFLHDLEPETVYCLKVKAHLYGHIGLYSPVYCKQTPKAWVGLPVPENVRIHALNMKCRLYWDGVYDGNVSFLVQSLPRYKARMSHDISQQWHKVTGCENIRTTYCDLPSCGNFIGVYYFHVQAVHNHNKSPWSKMLQFESIEENEIGPPSVKLNVSEDSLTVFVASPGESDYKPMSEFYALTYHVWYWPNSSYTKKKELGDTTSPPYVISNLTPSTLYCLQVQAFSKLYNKSSKFSNVTCIETAKGGSTNSTIFIVFIVTLAVVLLMTGLICCVWRQIKYAFFPKCNPPVNIESIEGKRSSSSYLLTSEKPTEDSVVIVDSIIPDEATKDCKELKDVRRDSGNYSTEDDISENNNCYKTPEMKPV